MSAADTEFYYKEVDAEGHETLDVISAASNFNRWTFDTVAPFCSGEILEIGSGIGNISSYFAETGYSITLSDIRPGYRDILKEKFKDNQNVKGVRDIDLSHPHFENAYNDLLNSFDTVFALNVVEHIKDDSLAIKNCLSLLKKGGNLIILVPAFQSLYNSLDKSLMHYKRYNAKSLTELFRQNNSTTLHSFYFNAAGIPAWFISGKLQNHRTIPNGQMKLFNKLVPLLKMADHLLFKKLGLSVICVGTKHN